MKDNTENLIAEVLPKKLSLNDEGDSVPYVRVGCTYYKKILKTDRNGFSRQEMKVWKKEEILLDHGKDFLKTVPHYDDFAMKPHNQIYEPIVGKCLNLYSEFIHQPKEGEWKWTETLLKHIFGEQYELGIRYMQILYLHPDHSTVILALVSSERQTGKTTFLNWINAMFGSNVALISSSDFLSGFNSHYATKNIIAIEETLFEQKLIIEKLKSLATAKFLQINEKFITPYKIPFYGKIILTSNNEDKFAKVEEEEIRFFVRKVGRPQINNHAIEDELIKEIPAFLHFLTTLTPVDWSVSRSGFTTIELKNESLEAVVKESKSSLCKDLEMYLSDYFYSQEKEFVLATAIDIKKRFFDSNQRYEVSYIRTVLKNELKLIPEDNQRYDSFEDMVPKKVGRPYRFNRSKFVTE
jgi:Family of unknown function (DUF5906)